MVERTLFALSLVLAGCTGDDPPTDAPAETDADTDADADGDTDADTDADADTDSDTDTDTSPPVDLSFKVQVPSAGAGTEGIAIEVLAPLSGRYPEGAPIAIGVHGGWNSGAATPSQDLQNLGIISIGWVEPGAVHPIGTSGGLQDVRGPDTLRALADVIRYASGDLADADGKLITERITFALTDEVGLMAGSNGGNMALATLGTHASEIPNVVWLGAWESPIGDQQANVELNDNPFYQGGSCDSAGCPFGDGFVDALSWDPNGTTSARHDGTITFDGQLVVAGAPANYLATMPSGFNGQLVQLTPSAELAEAVRSLGVSFFAPDGPPPWLTLDAQGVDAYWSARDGSLHIADVHADYPGLLIIHGQRVDDHVQTQVDYPHATTHLEGWKEAGHAWYRLNPDAVYQAAAAGSSDPSVFTENDAGVGVALTDPEDQMIPNVQGNTLQTAIVLELVDRAHYGDTSADLDATLH